MHAVKQKKLAKRSVIRKIITWEKIPAGNSWELLLKEYPCLHLGREQFIFPKIVFRGGKLCDCEPGIFRREMGFPGSVREGWQAWQEAQHQRNYTAIGPGFTSWLVSVGS